jgi:AraC-like DNA-binding protein
MGIVDNEEYSPSCGNLSGLDVWRKSIRQIYGSSNSKQDQPDVFSGWGKLRQCCGLDALDVACNVGRIDRAMVDVRRDQIECYLYVLQFSGRSSIVQNDAVAELDVGDGVLVDSARPSTFHYPVVGSRQIWLHLPRQHLVTYLGFEPQGGVRCEGTRLIARMLHNFVGLAGIRRDGSARAVFGDLLVFDLLGLMLAPTEVPAISSSVHADKLFKRVCAQIECNYANPALKISDIAKNTGISVRYIQKLFTLRHDSFSRHLERYRLERATMLLRRRALLPVKISISSIADSCGFRSLAHFSRSFSERIGVPPSSFAQGASEHLEELSFAGARSVVHSQLNC